MSKITPEEVCWVKIEESRIFLSILIFLRENTQVPPQPMPEIPETHLYYTKVLLPPLTYFINNFLPLFSLRGTILWAQR